MIIIVDDSEGLRFLLAVLLETELGVSCLGMESMADVLAHADEVLRSEVLILDINLGPGQPDGIAVFEWLRQQGYRGMIFFFTGHAKDSPFVKKAALTGVPVLEKPMSLEDFVPLIEGSLGSHHRFAR